MSKELSSNNEKKYTKPVKSAPIQILPKFSLSHIYYLIMRRIQLYALSIKFYFPNLILILLYGTINYLYEPLIIDNLHYNNFQTLSILYYGIMIGLLAFPLEIMYPVLSEKGAIKSEIRHLFYSPLSYYLSVFIFYAFKMILYNSSMTFIFHIFLPITIEYKIYYILIFLPIIYLAFQLFLLFIIPENNSMFLLTIIFYSLSYFKNTLLGIVGTGNNNEKRIMIFYKFIYKIDPHVLLAKFIHSLDWQNKYIKDALGFFAGDKLNASFKINCDCSFRDLVGKLCLNMFVYVSVGIIMIDFWYRPRIRLRVGRE
ncbi:hypothetical protein EQH57_0389 [Dictyocoela roeselum]|nr:hypothetical protein EQH57_0389 [Dictyocoela roeselum]